MQSTKFFLRKIKWYIYKYIFRKSVILSKLNDFEMYLDLVTPGISKTLFVYKTREEDMIKVIKDEIRPGMTIIDCGSNIGFYPLLEAKILDGEGTIYAVEPDYRNFKLLEMNVTASKYNNTIKTFQIAMSNKSGSCEMFVAKQSNLNKLSSKDDSRFKNRHKVENTVLVKTITIDDFIEQENIEVDFIRMDIEGYEVEVFRGMKKLLNNVKSGFKIFLELHPHAYSDDRSFSEQLKYLFDRDFAPKLIISAGYGLDSGEERPKKFKDLGYIPSTSMESDGFIRDFYSNIKKEDVISLTCTEPKSSRYVLLEKC